MVCFELILTFGFIFDKGVENTSYDSYGTFPIILITVDRYSDLYKNYHLKPGLYFVIF